MPMNVNAMVDLEEIILCQYTSKHAYGLWQDNMVISAFSNVQKQYLVVQRQFMPQIVVHGGTKLERQNH